MTGGNLIQNIVRTITLVVVGSLVSAGCGDPQPQVMIETPLGDITIEVYQNRAPITATNFLRLVDEGRFVGASFYRSVTLTNQPYDSVKIEVIQGGLGDAGEDVPPIEHEATNVTGIHHADGVVSMARREPGTASSEIFICIGDQPELDAGGTRNPDRQGFAAFGRVIGGMDVVRSIQHQPVEGQKLVPPVPMMKVYRVR
jgi:peptidyl-prolyl cis-trans isomerase A (cyclophilin A)